MAWGTPSAIGAKGEGNNANVTPGLPSYATGDILFVASMSRYNSGGPAVMSVSGYTELLQYSATTNNSVALFAKKAGASESAPTVAVSGGVGGGTVIAFMWSMSGGDADNLGTIVVASATNNDTSADFNIETSALTPTEPNCAVIAIGTSRDDDPGVVGVTAPTWGTNIGYADSSLGADALLCAAYQIQTSVVALSADYFVVPGNQPTTSIILALRAGAAASTPKARMLTMGVG